MFRKFLIFAMRIISDPSVFEGDGKAVLYTGDIRCEPWHIDALLQNPCMFEYAIGRDLKQLKTLDKIYLDTSFTEDVQFQTKSEGLRELLEKVAQYPEDTLVYFSSWTYGYEDVWIALAKALGTQVCSSHPMSFIGPELIKFCRYMSMTTK